MGQKEDTNFLEIVQQAIDRFMRDPAQRMCVKRGHVNDNLVPRCLYFEMVELRQLTYLMPLGSLAHLQSITIPQTYSEVRRYYNTAAMSEVYNAVQSIALRFYSNILWMCNVQGGSNE